MGTVGFYTPLVLAVTLTLTHLFYQIEPYSVDSIKRTVHLAFQGLFSIKNTVY